jgi:uncharacterized protein (TIGR00730 family)
MSIQSLAVFCGSKNGNNPIYLQHAMEVGRLLAQHNITLIYGGGNVGIMGTLADAVMNNGGKVVGIIPKVLLEWEREHGNITELIVSDDMHARKKSLYEMCDAALILPGGFGTMDELFEILTWNQLSIHDKKIFIMNSARFYDHILAHIKQMEEQGFLYENAKDKIRVITEPQQLIKYL